MYGVPVDDDLSDDEFGLDDFMGDMGDIGHFDDHDVEQIMEDFELDGYY